MPSFIVLAQQEHCFPERGGIHPLVIKGQKSPAEIGLSLSILERVNRLSMSQMGLLIIF